MIKELMVEHVEGLSFDRCDIVGVTWDQVCGPLSACLCPACRVYVYVRVSACVHACKQAGGVSDLALLLLLLYCSCCCCCCSSCCCCCFLLLLLLLPAAAIAAYSALPTLLHVSTLDRPRHTRAYAPHTPPFARPDHGHFDRAGPWAWEDRLAVLQRISGAQRCDQGRAPSRVCMGA